METDGLFADFSPTTGGDQQLLDRARSLTARQLADSIVATDLAAGNDCAAFSRTGVCRRRDARAAAVN